MIANILVLLYIIIGIYICYYEWKTNLVNDYNKAKEIGNVDDSMLITYWLFVIILWPVKVIVDICNR